MHTGRTRYDDGDKWRRRRKCKPLRVRQFRVLGSDSTQANQPPSGVGELVKDVSGKDKALSSSSDDHRKFALGKHALK